MEKSKRIGEKTVELVELPSERDQLAEWVRDYLLTEGPHSLKQPLSDNELSGVINELFNEIEGLKQTNKRNQTLADDRTQIIRQKEVELEQTRLELDKCQQAKADLLAKAESLLNEKRILEEGRNAFVAENASLRTKMDFAHKEREAALKRLSEAENDLVAERLISARLEGYLEAIEDAKPPRMVAEAPGPGMADRIAARRQWAQNRRPGGSY